MKKYGLLAFAVLVSGCDTLTGWFPPPPPSTAIAVEERLTARVIPLDKCPVTDSGNTAQFAPLVAAILPFVIQLGTSFVSAEIQKAQNNLTTSYTAYGVVPAFGNPRCLVIVRGRFGQPSRALEAKGKITPTILQTIGAAEQPSLYVEIKMTAADATKRQFKPVFVQFNDTAAPNPGSTGEKSVGVLLAFATKPVGTAAPTADQVTKSADIVVPFSLGTLKRGTYLQGSSSSPASMTDLFAEQTRTVPVQTGKDKLPDTLDAYAIVTESSDPTLFDTVVQKAVADKGFADAVSKLVDALQPTKAAGK